MYGKSLGVASIWFKSAKIAGGQTLSYFLKIYQIGQFQSATSIEVLRSLLSSIVSFHLDPCDPENLSKTFIVLTVQGTAEPGVEHKGLPISFFIRIKEAFG